MKIFKDMRERINSLEWNTIISNFNSDELEYYNIFDNPNIRNFIEDAVEHKLPFDVFKKELDGWLRHSFWSKSEYEMLAGGLFQDEDKYTKIDIYYQLKPNLHILAKYAYDTLGLNEVN